MSKERPCSDCRMSRFCNTTSVYNNTRGWGNPKANLVIVLDAPGNLLAEKLLVWHLKRLSLTGDDVWVDYLWRCPLPKELKKKELQVTQKICWTSHPRDIIMDESKTVVLAGNWSVDFLADAKMKEWHGKLHTESGAWVIYSFLYLLMSPGECKDTSCVLWKAAEQAGLTPKFVIDIEPFRFPSKKLAGG